MIIGLAGAKTAGKNTFADFITKEFGNDYIVKHWSFAEDLKKSAAAALGYSDDSTVSAVKFCDSLKVNGIIKICDVDSLGEWSITGREYLQWFGTEAHRDIFGDDFWVDNLMNKIKTATPTWTSWKERLDIITDVRFPNEAEAIADEGGKVIRIKRPEVESDGDTHASEIPLHESLVWGSVLNTKGLHYLQGQVHPIVQFAIEVMNYG